MATNTWLGTNIEEAKSELGGLDYFALKLPFMTDFDQLIRHLHSKNITITPDDKNTSAIYIHDPDKIKIQISY